MAAEGFSTTLAVRFIDLGGATRIEISGDVYPDAGIRDSQQVIWECMLDQLQSYFSII
jgi:hypothetical protein